MVGQVKRGFTLIELVVTLFVLALAVGVAAPSIARGVDTVRTRAEAAGRRFGVGPEGFAWLAEDK